MLIGESRVLRRRFHYYGGIQKRPGLLYWRNVLRSALLFFTRRRRKNGERGGFLSHGVPGNTGWLAGWLAAKAYNTLIAPKSVLAAMTFGGRGRGESGEYRLDWIGRDWMGLDWT